MPENRIVLDVLKGKTVFPPPLWMMRQAGRYLPEYRETRQTRRELSSISATIPTLPSK